MNYKSAFFFNTLERKDKISDGEEDDSTVLTNSIVKQFHEKTDYLIQGIISNDENLNMTVLKLLLEFTNFTPIDEVTGLLINSSILNYLMKFKEHPLRIIALEIFENISFSQKHIETLMTLGMLDFIYEDLFNVNEDINNHVRNIVSNIIYLNDFTRALLYSTNILGECLNEMNSNHVNSSLEDWVSKILMMFCYKGPIMENINKFPNYIIMHDKWTNFQDYYKFNNVFSENLFEEFCNSGISLSNNLPYKFLFDFFLKKSESKVAIVNFANALKFYLIELVNTSKQNKAEVLILPFQQFIQRLKNCDGIDYFIGVILKIYALLYSIKINSNDMQFMNCGKEGVELIISTLKTTDFQFIPEGFHALSNIIACFPILTEFVLKDDDFIEFIRNTLINGNFQERSAVAWLFFVLMVNKPDFIEFSDVQGLVEMMESQLHYDFTKHAFNSLEQAFKYQEENEPEGRSIIDYFDDCNGFSVVSKIQEETDNNDIYELADNFYNIFSDVNLEINEI